MKRESQLIAQLRERLPEYMAQRGQIVGSKGKKLIRCIDPAHRDSTPSMSYFPKNQTLHCFGCGKSYDLFDLIALDYPECDNFAKQVQRACLLFDIPFLEDVSVEKKEQNKQDATGYKQVKVAEYPVQPIREMPEKQDYTAFINEKIDECGVGGAYFEKRGVSKALCEKHQLFEWQGRAYLPVWEEKRCVSYCARATDETTEPRYKNSPGAMGIFGSDYLTEEANPGGALVITEAIFDALAAEACGYRAVSLCGAGNVARFLRLCERHTVAANTYIYIAAGDADQAGEKMNQALCEGLRAQGLSCTVLPLPTGCKDVAEAFLNVRSDLECALSGVENADRAAYEKESALAAIPELFSLCARRAGTGAIETGIKGLDRLACGGLWPGLYTLGAASSIGKTSLLLQIADEISLRGNDVLFFSLEMSRFELMAKSLSRLSWEEDSRQALTASEVLSAGPALQNGKALLLERAVERYRLSAAQLFLREGIAEIGVREIRAAVGEHLRLRGRRPVVMVDYLQIIKPADPRANDKQNIDRTVVELKRISRDFDLPVVVLSSFNRENYRNAVTMEAFKESGAVEYSSDLLFGLQLAGMGEAGFDLNAAKSKEPREIELVLLKNRSGLPYGKIRLNYHAKYSKFIEQAEKIK